jgi:hypothetical protein
MTSSVRSVEANSWITEKIGARSTGKERIRSVMGTLSVGEGRSPGKERGCWATLNRSCQLLR